MEVGLITVEVSENGEKVEVILDLDGAKELKQYIEEAERDGDAHLRAPSWAGAELSEEPMSLNKSPTIAKDLTFRCFKL